MSLVVSFNSGILRFYHWRWEGGERWTHIADMGRRETRVYMPCSQRDSWKERAPAGGTITNLRVTELQSCV